MTTRDRFQCCLCNDLNWEAQGRDLHLVLGRATGRARQRFGVHEGCLSMVFPTVRLAASEWPERRCPVCGEDAGRFGNLRVTVETGDASTTTSFYIHDDCLHSRLATSSEVYI